MPGFSFPASDTQQPMFQDSGQGASSRLASWGAWTADPSVMISPDTSVIIRMDNNMPPANTPIYLLDGYGNEVLDGNGQPIILSVPDSTQPSIPVGQGGCGTWAPVLDGFSNGATSGGDNCFYDNV